MSSDSNSDSIKSEDMLPCEKDGSAAEDNLGILSFLINFMGCILKRFRKRISRAN